MSDVASPVRRGIHIPVDEIDERAEVVDLGRIVRLTLLFIPYFLCLIVSWVLTQIVAACQEGWSDGKRPKGKR